MLKSIDQPLQYAGEDFAIESVGRAFYLKTSIFCLKPLYLSVDDAKC